MDHAGKLEAVGNGNEAALAEVEHLAADGEESAARAPHVEAEEARVERIALGAERHGRRR
jgi:hypothetical protein